MLDPGRGSWIVAFTFVVVMGFSAVPSPLYPLYAQRDGLSPLTITFIFAAYAAGVVPVSYTHLTLPTN